MTARSAPGALAAIGAGALLLLWPALLNGYPLVFSDTGAFLAQALMPWPIWDKPYVYGPLLHLLAGPRLSLWGPALAQGLALSWVLWLAARVLAPPGSRPAWWRHPALCAGLALLTAAPWFAALLMPDMLAPLLVLCLFLLGFAEDRLARWERVALSVLATFAAAAHLAHLPLAAALCLAVLALRRRPAPVLRCALPLALALAVLAGTNLAAHGRAAISPHGAVFALARLVADGPAARTIEARCGEAPGWHLCRWAGRLPADSDAFLWAPDGPVWAPEAPGGPPRGPAALAPEARAILAETLRREPLGVLRAAAGNTLRQLALAGIGDTLGPDHLEATVGRMLAKHFPPAEAARFMAARQARGELAARAAPFALPHALMLAGAAGLLLVPGVWRRARRNGPGAGLLACVLVGLLANAAATGALSGPHARYQARIAWLLPLAVTLVLARIPPVPARTGGGSRHVHAAPC